jgi:hypothetical protein
MEYKDLKIWDRVIDESGNTGTVMDLDNIHDVWVIWDFLSPLFDNLGYGGFFCLDRNCVHYDPLFLISKENA